MRGDSEALPRWRPRLKVPAAAAAGAEGRRSLGRTVLERSLEAERLMVAAEVFRGVSNEAVTALSGQDQINTWSVVGGQVTLTQVRT